MERDKQIEEMAKHCTYHHNGECLACANHPTECDLMCEMFGVFANLVMADYRKTSDVAEEIFEEIEKMLINEHIESFKALDDTWTHRFKESLFIELNKLKKKYTEAHDGT